MFFFLFAGEEPPSDIWEIVNPAVGNWAVNGQGAPGNWEIANMPSGTWSYEAGANGAWTVTVASEGSWSGTPPTSNARFITALAHANPRSVAGTDPIASITLATNGLPDTNIPSGSMIEFPSGEFRTTYGKGRTTFASYAFTFDQLHRNGTDPAFTSPFGVEVVYTGRKIEFGVRSDGQRMHVFVDGVLTSASGYLIGQSDGQYRYWMLDFGTAATRRIRVVSNNNPLFGPVRIETGYALTSPAPAYPCNMLLIGDSFHEPAFPTYAIGGIPVLLGELLGVQITPSASGGTGHLNDAGGVPSGKCNFAQRIVKDLTLSPVDDPQWDVIMLCDSGNDGVLLPAQEAAYEANKDFEFATARAAWPNATILGLGPMFKEAGGFSVVLSDYMEATTQAACAANNCTYVPGMSAAIGALSAGTLNSYFHVDGHPNDVGHAALAAIANTLIRAAVS